MSEAKLRKLIREWKREEAKYFKAAHACKPRIYELEQARYEGESIAFRWCREDLEKLLATPETSPASPALASGSHPQP